MHCAVAVSWFLSSTIGWCLAPQAAAQPDLSKTTTPLPASRFRCTPTPRCHASFFSVFEFVLLLRGGCRGRDPCGHDARTNTLSHTHTFRRRNSDTHCDSPPSRPRSNPIPSEFPVVFGFLLGKRSLCLPGEDCSTAAVAAPRSETFAANTPSREAACVSVYAVPMMSPQP